MESVSLLWHRTQKRGHIHLATPTCISIDARRRERECARERESKRARESKGRRGRERARASERDCVEPFRSNLMQRAVTATGGFVFSSRTPAPTCVCVCVCAHVCGIIQPRDRCVHPCCDILFQKDSLTIVSVVTQRETNEISRISHTKLVDPLTLSRLSLPPPSSES